MKQRLTMPVILGLLLWAGVIMLFDRHDLAFYAVSFFFAVTLTLLTIAQSTPKFIEIKMEDDLND